MTENQEQVNKYKKRLFIGLAVTLIALALFAIVMAKLISINSECVNDPFVYAANTIIDGQGEVIYSVCSCDINGQFFYFDMEGRYKENPLFKDLK